MPDQQPEDLVEKNTLLECISEMDSNLEETINPLMGRRQKLARLKQLVTSNPVVIEIFELMYELVGDKLPRMEDHQR